jgi:hypothetical protein
LNPAVATSGTTDKTVTLDNSVTVTKGATKTLSLACNTASGATGALKVGMTNTQVTSTFTAYGVTSSNTVNATGTGVDQLGQVMTLASGGSLAVSNSSAMPAFMVQAGGSTGVVGAVYKLRASNENINLTELALTLTSGAAADVTSADVYQGTTLLGTVYFGNSTTASTTINNVAITRDTDTDLTVKLNLASIGSNLPAGAGDRIRVNVASVKGTGASSGNTIYSTGSTTANGVKIQKSFPVFTYSTAGATATTGVNDLLVLTIAANASGDGVALNKLTFTLATTTATLASPTFSGPSGNVASTTNVILNAAGTAITVYFDSTSNTADRVIAAGQSKTYTLRGNVTLTGSNTTGAVSVALKGDTAEQASNAIADSVSGSNVWSPNSTTSPAATTTNDWTNNYGLGGCYTTAGLGNDCTVRTVSK